MYLPLLPATGPFNKVSAPHRSRVLISSRPNSPALDMRTLRDSEPLDCGGVLSRVEDEVSKTVPPLP